jgi:hypothetical protein
MPTLAHPPRAASLHITETTIVPTTSVPPRPTAPSTGPTAELVPVRSLTQNQGDGDDPPQSPARDNRPQHLPQVGTMTHLVWNCQGSGDSLRSSTINHLARLLASTKAQVCFLIETRNSSITKTAIKNRFNYKEAFVVPAQGQSGGLWLIWSDEVDITVIDHSHNFIFALCINKTTMQ